MTPMRLLLLLLLLACLPLAAVALTRYEVRVVDKKPQSRDLFVQGLEISDGFLYVSSGHYGRSRLLRYRFADGELDTGRRVDPRLFAEGVTVLGDAVYQLTWRSRAMLVYRKNDLTLLRTRRLQGEGWGLTNDGRELIYSDGSEYLHFLSPASGELLRSLRVLQDGAPVRHLNELEWVDGAIWANVWQTDRIVVIDPASGEVTASVDLSGLLPASERRANTDVLNGIARDPADGALWVTGKYWPWLYRVELVPVDNAADTSPATAKSR